MDTYKRPPNRRDYFHGLAALAIIAGVVWAMATGEPYPTPEEARREFLGGYYVPPERPYPGDR